MTLLEGIGGGIGGVSEGQVARDWVRVTESSESVLCVGNTKNTSAVKEVWIKSLMVGKGNK